MLQLIWKARKATEEGVVISGFNFNDRFLSRNEWYTSVLVVYVMRVCAHVTLRTLTSVRVYLAWRQYLDRYGRLPFHDRSRSSGIFGQSVATLHIPLPLSISIVRSFLNMSCRIICLFRSPHTSNLPEPFPTCVSPFLGTEYRRRCRCNLVLSPYVSWRNTKESNQEGRVGCSLLFVGVRAYLRFCVCTECQS